MVDFPYLMVYNIYVIDDKQGGNIMEIWKVECHYNWDSEENSFSTYHFGSYKGALMWVVKNGKNLDWAYIEENKFIPCKKDNPEGQLYIGCDTIQFFKKEEISSMIKIYDTLCK